MPDPGTAAPSEPPADPQVLAGVSALEAELSTLLRRSRAFSEEIARSVHPDLEAAAYGLLSRIVDAFTAVPGGGALRAADLADHFGIDKSTVSRQVRLLEQLGLLERVTDPADARALLLQPTEVGLSRLQVVRAARRGRLNASLAEWQPSDIAELARLLGRFNDRPTDRPTDRPPDRPT
jgi:DNA-binding MarR family transcriptional regulator